LQGKNIQVCPKGGPFNGLSHPPQCTDLSTTRLIHAIPLAFAKARSFVPCLGFFEGFTPKVPLFQPGFCLSPPPPPFSLFRTLFFPPPFTCYTSLSFFPGGRIVRMVQMPTPPLRLPVFSRTFQCVTSLLDLRPNSPDSAQPPPPYKVVKCQTGNSFASLAPSIPPAFSAGDCPAIMARHFGSFSSTGLCCDDLRRSFRISPDQARLPLSFLSVRKIQRNASSPPLNIFVCKKSVCPGFFCSPAPV